MIFLCGLFFPIEKLPSLFRPLVYLLPLTYGADALHGAVHREMIDNNQLRKKNFHSAPAGGVFAIETQINTQNPSRVD